MQYVVPQFLDVEAKIIGPISARQFIIIIVSFGMAYVWFQLFTSPLLFIPAIFITLGFGGVMAFAKVNGQSMHFFLLNVIQTFRRPRLKVWVRMPYVELAHEESDEEIKVAVKQQATTSRLAEVSLMVDTGGAYESNTDDRPAGVAVSALPNEKPNGQSNEQAPDTQDEGPGGNVNLRPK